MMGKWLPASLLIVGIASFASAFSLGPVIDGIGVGIAVAYIYAFCVPFLLCWSYFFGPQRGRPVHFLQISVYCSLGVLSLLKVVGVISSQLALAVMFVLIAVLLYGAIANYRSIHDDYKNGIKRNFFKSRF